MNLIPIRMAKVQGDWREMALQQSDLAWESWTFGILGKSKIAEVNKTGRIILSEKEKKYTNDKHKRIKNRFHHREVDIWSIK